MTSTRKARETAVPDSRPARESVTELLILSAVSVAMTSAIVGLANDGDDRLRHSLEWAASAGERTLGHLGWGLGAYISTLMAFYAIVIGGQLVAPEFAAARMRRVLGAVAEFMIAGLFPALVIVVIYCVSSPAESGALFVIVPVWCVMLFLAIQLGGFIVIDSQQRLADAERSKEWARARIDSMRDRSQRAVPIVLLVNALAPVVLGSTVTLVLAGEGFSSAPVVLNLVMAVLLVLAGVYALFIHRTARDSLTRVLVWTMFALLYSLFAAALISVAASPPGDAVVLGSAPVMLLVCASTFVPVERVSPAALNWSLRGVGTSLALRSVVRTHRRAVRVIAELSPMENFSSSQRFMEALKAVISRVSAPASPSRESDAR